MYKIYLATIGNPDHGQNPNEPVAPSYFAEGLNIDEIVKEARAYIDKYDLGAGNWAGGTIIRETEEGNVKVGWMSYNGRVWADAPQ